MDDFTSSLSDSERALFEDLERQLAPRVRWRLPAVAFAALVALLVVTFAFKSPLAFVAAGGLFVVAVAALTRFVETLPPVDFVARVLRHVPPRPR